MKQKIATVVMMIAMATVVWTTPAPQPTAIKPVEACCQYVCRGLDGADYNRCVRDCERNCARGICPLECTVLKPTP